MKSKWKVTSNIINGKTMYGVYRQRDISETDHSGNRDYAGGYVDNRETAAIVAAELNRIEEKTI